MMTNRFSRAGRARLVAASQDRTSNCISRESLGRYVEVVVSDALFYPFTRCPCLHQSTFCAPTPETPKQLHESFSFGAYECLWCFMRLRNAKNQSRRAWPQNVYVVILCDLCETLHAKGDWRQSLGKFVEATQQLLCPQSFCPDDFSGKLSDWYRRQTGICKAVAGALYTAVDPAPTSQHQKGYHPPHLKNKEVLVSEIGWKLVLGADENAFTYTIKKGPGKPAENPVCEIHWLGTVDNCASYLDIFKGIQPFYHVDILIPFNYILFQIRKGLIPNAFSPKTGPVGPACVPLPVFEGSKAGEKRLERTETISAIQTGYFKMKRFFKTVHHKDYASDKSVLFFIACLCLKGISRYFQGVFKRSRQPNADCQQSKPNQGTHETGETEHLLHD